VPPMPSTRSGRGSRGASSDGGAADGFNLMVDILPSGIDLIVDELVPVLQKRGLVQHDYAHETLRANLGLPDVASAKA
jgi:hypothetical protein